MRTSTILVSLLAIYALVSTCYFVVHTGVIQTDCAELVALRRAPPRQTLISPLPHLSQRQTRQRPHGQIYQFACSLKTSWGTRTFNRLSVASVWNATKGRLSDKHSLRIDTVDAHVSFEKGVENYTAIQQNNRERMSLASISGAWSEGEFGTLLRQTRTLLTTQSATLQTSLNINGVSAIAYRIEVNSEDSPWALSVGAESYRVPFRTDVSVERATGQILQIERTLTAMPPRFGISEIQWSVVLKPVQMDGKIWLLPGTGKYSVLYQRSNHREWNVISFSDYHRYAATSVIHF